MPADVFPAAAARTQRGPSSGAASVTIAGRDVFSGHEPAVPRHRPSRRDDRQCLMISISTAIRLRPADGGISNGSSRGAEATALALGDVHPCRRRPDRVAHDTAQTRAAAE